MEYTMRQPVVWPCCTMLHPTENLRHLVHTTGFMCSMAYTPLCTPWGMSWGSTLCHGGHLSHGSIHDILPCMVYDMVTHGDFHSVSQGRVMIYPRKTFHGTKPSMDDRWAVSWTNHGAYHNVLNAMYHREFSMA